MPPDHPPTGADLLRAVGLLADGPVAWDRPVPLAGPGVYTIELANPLPSAPIELSRVGKWIERVPMLRLDGIRPTSKALDARLASYWIPGQVVVFIGSAATSVGGRVQGLRATVLGDRKPYAGAQWLATLRDLSRARIWFAATDAPEEYEDALLSAFAEGVPPEVSARTRDPRLLLPWAVLRRPTGERREHGISGAFLPEPVTRPTPTTTLRDVPPAEPDPTAPSLGGVRAPRSASTRAAGGSSASAPGGRTSSGTSRSGGRRTSAAAGGPSVAPSELSAEGKARLEAELDELRTVQRPAAIARVATAREHGDLKENAEYHAAREELGFIEGRIQALEARLRNAVIIDAAGSVTAMLGSTVVVEIVDEISEPEQVTYQLVSSAEARPAAGRLSTSSPVGQALLGRSAGDVAIVRTPSGDDVHYRIVEVR